METINAMIEQVPVTTLLFAVVTGSLVLSILIGGSIYLRRARSGAGPLPVAAASGQGLEQALSAYGARTATQSESELRAWETELGDRMQDLETAFASLASRLTRLGAVERDGLDVLHALQQRNSGAATGPGRHGNSADARAGRSEEQMRLLKRLNARTPNNAIGA